MSGIVRDGTEQRVRQCPLTQTDRTKVTGGVGTAWFADWFRPKAAGRHGLDMDGVGRVWGTLRARRAARK